MRLARRRSLLARPMPAGAVRRRRSSSPPSRPQAEIVTVDVVVDRRQGEPVLDLRREDFSGDRGRRRRRRSRASRPSTGPRPPRRRRAAARAPASRAPRRTASPRRGQEPDFVIVFDELHLDPAEAVRARAAVADFLATRRRRRRPRRPRRHGRGHALDGADAGGTRRCSQVARAPSAAPARRDRARRDDRLRGDAHRPRPRPDRDRRGDAALPRHGRDPQDSSLARQPRVAEPRGRQLAQPDVSPAPPGLRARAAPQRADARGRRARARGARRRARAEVAGACLGRAGPGPAAARLPPRGRRRRGARTRPSTSSTRAGFGRRRAGMQAEIGPAAPTSRPRALGSWLTEARERERGQRRRSPRDTGGFSRSRTGTTSAAGSPASAARRAATTCSATRRRTARPTAASARSR